jgi:hypothetical protein
VAVKVSQKRVLESLSTPVLVLVLVKWKLRTLPPPPFSTAVGFVYIALHARKPRKRFFPTLPRRGSPVAYGLANTPFAMQIRVDDVNFAFKTLVFRGRLPTNLFAHRQTEFPAVQSITF